MYFVTKNGPNVWLSILKWQKGQKYFMAVFIVLVPYLLTTKLRCLQKNNFGHTNKCIYCTFLIMCCLCPEKLLKAWLQNSHLYALIFAWVKMCSRSFWFDKNPLPQMSHLYFRFSGSSWFFICFDNCCFSLHWQSR